MIERGKDGEGVLGANTALEGVREQALLGCFADHRLMSEHFWLFEFYYDLAS